MGNFSYSTPPPEEEGHPPKKVDFVIVEEITFPEIEEQGFPGPYSYEVHNLPKTTPEEYSVTPERRN